MAAKERGKPNGNIMNFFQKASAQRKEGSSHGPQELFFESEEVSQLKDHSMQIPTPPRESPPQPNPRVHENDPSDELRFNEEGGPVKRRRMDDTELQWTSNASPSEVKASRGPFIDKSDDEGAVQEQDTPIHGPDQTILDKDQDAPGPPIPPLQRESTSMTIPDDFDDIEDFIEDAEEGEEYMMRRMMEEQAELERAIEDSDDDDVRLDDDTQRRDSKSNAMDFDSVVMPEDAANTVCPICSGSTAGLSEQQVSVHVNDCIDGKAKPLAPPPKATSSSTEKTSDQENTVAPKRFQRAAIARPGQENPFNFTSPTTNTGSSAFSKLMSGHAEDAAWANAAAAENASRGKPAYQRTCPFYKIMPGLFICVDAFRYGAVKGCNAYFLSHFHSDHYIGLTSTWCHGPIYCSRVTGNLVRQQLRVDPKWVVDLTFEEQVEVPNTQGVQVTMIPANHCPGSSLFLFEKTLSKTKTHRILHCGDFRACPAHIQHPKLRPTVTCPETKKKLDQKIDVCYLDTTYLTPKYAFPSQETVINACASMCVSLSKEIVDASDGWETMKRERAGAGMVKFIQPQAPKLSPSNSSLGAESSHIKTEPDQESGQQESASESHETTGVKTEAPEEGDPTMAPIKPEPPVKADSDSKPSRASPSPNPFTLSDPKAPKSRGRLLVIVGTYSIGKERICLGVAKALGSKIYAPPSKQRIVAALEDPELSARMTSNPLDAQVHMQMLMEIRAETLAEYLSDYRGTFTRIVGFRPSGWNYRPPRNRLTDNPTVQTVLRSENWRSGFGMRDLVPQRGSTKQAMCFGVPYSEHSSFRELSMFVCALRIERVVPTVNVGSAKSRERMKVWCERWKKDREKNGLFSVEEGARGWS